MAKAVVAKKGNKTASHSHPPYFEMISEAITTLKERTGSSQQALAKFIEDKYKSCLPPNFKKLLSLQLKNFTKSEKLVKIKNSYKLSSTQKLTQSVKEDKKKDSVKKKSVKTKRLSQVKTLEVMEKITVKSRKMKRLSQVKTPDGLQNKKKNNLTKNRK